MDTAYGVRPALARNHGRVTVKLRTPLTDLEALIENARTASRGEGTAGDENSEYFLAAFVH